MRARSPAGLAMPLAAAAAAWPFVEPHLPVLRRAAVAVLPAGARPLRLLHLSDLHLLPRHRRRARWVRELARERPDLVVSTGDHLSAEESVPLLASTLGALADAGAVCAFVPGNNDYYRARPPALLGYLTGTPPVRGGPDLAWSAVARALRDVGCTDLTHRRHGVEIAGTPLLLTGTDDAHLRRDDYAAVAGAVPAGVLGVGVTHTPARRLLAGFAGDGYRLVLAGHTHGGQLRLPFAGAIVTNCDLERHRARGLSPLTERPGNGNRPADARRRVSGRDEPDGWLNVSAGLGSSPYVPARLCCRPEATLLELVPPPR